MNAKVKHSAYAHLIKRTYWNSYLKLIFDSDSRIYKNYFVQGHGWMQKLSIVLMHTQLIRTYWNSDLKLILYSDASIYTN